MARAWRETAGSAGASRVGEGGGGIGFAGAKIAGGGRRLRWRLWLVVGSGGDREVEARALVGGRWIWEDPKERVVATGEELEGWDCLD